MKKSDEDLWITALAIAMLVVAVVVVLGVKVAIAEEVYGDWTCAFAHCVKVRP